jgi:hypothetical protein
MQVFMFIKNTAVTTAFWGTRRLSPRFRMVSCVRAGLVLQLKRQAHCISNYLLCVVFARGASRETFLERCHDYA